MDFSPLRFYIISFHMTMMVGVVVVMVSPSLSGGIHGRRAGDDDDIAFVSCIR
jgi:hypothetical protein